MRYYTIAELAERWGVSTGVVRQWKYRGKLPDPDFIWGRSPAWMEATIERYEDGHARPTVETG